MNLSAAAPGGFECRLTGAGGAAWPAPLHGWTACASPVAAANLSDGSYIFSVRAAGGALLSPSYAPKTCDTRIDVTPSADCPSGIWPAGSLP